MSALTGTAPKTTTSSTISGTQTSALDYLLNLLQGIAGTTSSNLTDASLTGLETIANATPTTASTVQTGASNTALSSLTSNLGYTAPKIDATKSIDAVNKDLSRTFTDVTLPGIAGKYGTGAGGAYGSDAWKAREYSGEQLSKTEATEDAQLQFAADYANQAADISSAGVRNNALSVAPNTINEPTVLTNDIIKNFLALLGGGTLNTTDLATAATAPTQQTVSTGGSTGLLSGLTGGTGAAVGSSLVTPGSLLYLSDVNAKEDVERVGNVDGFPIYKFRYKGDPTRRLGLVAQDVEKRLPGAVQRMPSGLKGVDYAAVLEDILKEAA